MEWQRVRECRLPRAIPYTYGGRRWLVGWLVAVVEVLVELVEVKVVDGGWLVVTERMHRRQRQYF